jgi:hypothetical protein
MHRIHNIYLKSLYEKRMCDKYIEDLFTCYIKDFSNEKEKIILDKMNVYCYNFHSSFSNKAICSSDNSCDVTLKRIIKSPD